ncbi:MAG: PLP-dependent aspartate aminotransferase family protein [Planctomycetota bacterium]
MSEPLYGTSGVHRSPIGPLSPPLIRASTSGQPDAETLRRMGSAECSGEFYQRMGHSNGREFEGLVATLEQTDGAVSFASGMAAMSAVLSAHLSSGDRVLIAEEIYGGTAAFAMHDLPRFGVAVGRFSALDSGSLQRALADGPAPKLVVFESPINPTLRVVDIRALAELARGSGARVVFDGTFSPPPIQRVLELGCDLVVHSASKFFGGHSDVLAGVVAGPHELLAPIEQFRRRTGGLLAPDPAWLCLRSWPTLQLRLDAQQAAALQVAEGLQEDVAAGRLAGVTYPGLPDHPDREIVQRQMNGGGCVLAIELPGGLPEVVPVLDRLRVIARAASLGGVESLATVPAFTTHAPLSPEQRQRAGISDGLMRVAIGLEGVDVLLGDLRQAIRGR